MQPPPQPSLAPTLGIVALLTSCFLCLGESARAQSADAGHNLSLKLEIRHAIDKGLDWLGSKQDPESGSWADDDYPALTALPLCAFLGSPSYEPAKPMPDFLRAGFDFLLRQQKTDGGIYGEGLATYNTSLALLALTLAGNPEFHSSILNARKFLIAQQADDAAWGGGADPFDGGIGYGGTYTHSDLSNTHLALEALHYSRRLLGDSASPPGTPGSPKLDWDAAIEFVQRCQNLPETNDQEWASGDPENRGGFVYYPGDSKAGRQVLPAGATALRSYGSMSYAGLLSFIYAELDHEDPRVVAALDWLKAHYSVAENPGMEHEGLYYYYHTMAKALTISGIETLELESGRQVDWREELARKLFDLQDSEGFWVNDTGRWWEKDPVLVTAYAVLALEHIYHSL